MIEESYVRFNTARMLKEAGFDVPCFNQYTDRGTVWHCDCPENGFYNTFSGGKDSQCLYHLVKLAGVKAKTHMNLTSVDPHEVIRFVKRNYPDVELIKPKMSIYDMAKKKRILPTRRFRWWISGKSYDKFYEDNFLQKKLDFKD